MTFLWYGQICVVVVVAILEEVAWLLQICNNFFYQMSKSLPVDLLFLKLLSGLIMYDLIRLLQEQSGSALLAYAFGVRNFRTVTIICII